MTSITFDEIYSRFYTKVEAFDLIDEDEEVVSEFMCNWLQSALFYPHIRKLFSTIEVDVENATISYELNYEIDEASDKNFVTEVLSWGIVFNWVDPKINSITNIVQHFGESDDKWYSQASHLAQLRQLRADSERHIRGLVNSRGFFNNVYLDGKAASAKLR